MLCTTGNANDGTSARKDGYEATASERAIPAAQTALVTHARRDTIRPTAAVSLTSLCRRRVCRCRPRICMVSRRQRRRGRTTRHSELHRTWMRPRCLVSTAATEAAEKGYPSPDPMDSAETLALMNSASLPARLAPMHHHLQQRSKEAKPSGAQSSRQDPPRCQQFQFNQYAEPMSRYVWSPRLTTAVLRS
jgi:hypothetical protein